MIRILRGHVGLLRVCIHSLMLAERAGMIIIILQSKKKEKKGQCLSNHSKMREVYLVHKLVVVRVLVSVARDASRVLLDSRVVRLRGLLNSTDGWARGSVVAGLLSSLGGTVSRSGLLNLTGSRGRGWNLAKSFSCAT